LLAARGAAGLAAGRRLGFLARLTGVVFAFDGALRMIFDMIRVY
jgi:hypothetical protein